MASNNFSYHIDLNEQPEDVLPLAVIPPKELAVVPPKEVVPSRPRVELINQEQAFYAQAFRRPSIAPPPPCLLLGDKPCHQELPKISLPQGTKLLPPVPRETLTKLTTNKFGEVTSAKYTTGAPHLTLNGVRATAGKVKFIPPSEAPKEPTKKRSAPT